MRFLVQPTAENVTRARPPVRAFLLFAGLALLGLVVQRVTNGGLTPAGVQAYYLPEGEALPWTALWEEIHLGAFLYGFLLLMLGSMLAVCPAVGPRLRATVFGAAFVGTLADLLAPFVVVRFPAAAGLRVVTFAVAALSLAALLAVVQVAWGRLARA